jgi:hypothetical protein
MPNDDAALRWKAQRMDIMDPGWRERHPELASLIADYEVEITTFGDSHHQWLNPATGQVTEGPPIHRP